MKRFLAFSLTVAVSVSADSQNKDALQWQDCGLMADVVGMEMLDYAHSPDPIVIGRPYNITRRFRSLMQHPIKDLTEKFSGEIRNSSGAWNTGFANGPFDRCGDEQYQTKCPLLPGTEFVFAEAHPATHAREPGTHRSLEHYYADGVYAGCAMVVYSYVADSTPLADQDKCGVCKTVVDAVAAKGASAGCAAACASLGVSGMCSAVCSAIEHGICNDKKVECSDRVCKLIKVCKGNETIVV